MAPSPRIPTQRGRRSAAPVPPLGSLTQRNQRPGTTCSVCGSEHVTLLSMNLTDGTPVQFTSCHGCEHRTWSRDGGDVIAVDDVLEHARKR
jgi:hypothetical protein